jgi:hypothetical protein
VELPFRLSGGGILYTLAGIWTPSLKFLGRCRDKRKNRIRSRVGMNQSSGTLAERWFTW